MDADSRIRANTAMLLRGGPSGEDPTTAYYRDPETGFLMMPGSRRPDGTMRKPRRVKEGYVPQDEVPLYESKGKRMMSMGQTPHHIPGLSKEIMDMKIDTFHPPKTDSPTFIPGLSFIKTPPSESEKPKKKKAPPAPAPVPVQSSSTNNSQQPTTDPVKKLRNLKKKLRDIEALEIRLNSGEIPDPEPEQLLKVTRKEAVKSEIQALEQSAALSTTT